MRFTLNSRVKKKNLSKILLTLASNHFGVVIIRKNRYRRVVPFLGEAHHKREGKSLCTPSSNLYQIKYNQKHVAPTVFP